jgi:hypothetical protein
MKLLFRNSRKRIEILHDLHFVAGVKTMFYKYDVRWTVLNVFVYEVFNST